MREDGRVFEWEAEFYRKDGSRIWTSTNARAVRDSASGELLGYEGTVEDITERKKAEEALRRSLDRLVALHEAGILLGSTLELEEAGARLLEIMRRISGFTAAAISMPAENGRLAVCAHRARGPGRRGPASPRRAPGERGRHRQGHDADLRPVGRAGGRRRVVLPLKVRERAVGVLEVYGPRSWPKRTTSRSWRA
jgi:hypothetical protein